MPQQLMNVSQQDAAFVEQFSGDLKKFREALMLLFPERAFLIQQIMMALISANHVLIYGDYGTAKSMIATAVFGGIRGPGIHGEEPRFFSIQLDAETIKADVIGSFNPKVFQEDGKIVLEVDGYLSDSHFAYIDEMFDALHVLRGINDVLHERELREGGNTIPAHLMTTIGATNRSPEEIERMYKVFDLGAYNDRFLFVSEVEYLENPESQETMLRNALLGHTFSETIGFADIQKIVEIIRRTNQFPNTRYIQVFRDVINAYELGLKEHYGEVVSDRRMVWLTQVVEAAAMMQGRTSLYLDDILAAVYGLVSSSNDPRYALFMDVAIPIIEAAKQEIGENVDQTERMLLDRLNSELSSLESEVSQGDLRNASFMGHALLEAKNILDALADIQPKLDQTEQDRVSLMQRAELLKNHISS